jgi:ribonucleoside-triphosphate reductase
VIPWPEKALDEAERLCHYMDNFALLPGGRHLWATGVANREYLFNCHVAGWGKKLSDHFEFSFLRLMEGGGVGANYSTRYIKKFGAPQHKIDLHITCHEDHADYEELSPYLSQHENEPWATVEDSREGWAWALSDLIDYAFGVRDSLAPAYDVSEVRPSGSELKTFGGTASGPAPLARMLHEVASILNTACERGELTPLDAMEIDHAIAECVVSGGNRRSARMSIVRWDDPYIREFLACKKDTGKHWTTNISVEIDDKFIEGLARGYERHNCAKEIHRAVCYAMLENGEPGYWNSSLSQKGEIGEIVATNPCGEIALESWENCNLGHVNLDYFWDKPWEELVEAHRLMTRFLMRATFGDVNDPKQQNMLTRNRRIGVGHLGVQGYWAKRGVRYSGISGGCAAIELRRLYQEVRQEARTYAFQLRIPEPVKVTTVAPTGSVAKLPGVSEGIHPIYARHFERRVRFSKRDEAQFQTVMEAMSKGFEVEDDVYDASGMTAVVVYPTEDILLSQCRSAGQPDNVVESTEDLSIRDMLNVQQTYQQYWADNAVSYTVNIPEGAVSAEELAEILAEYLPTLKGTTIMVDASRPQAPYTRITRQQYESAVATMIEDSTDESCANGACPVR